MKELNKEITIVNVETISNGYILHSSEGKKAILKDNKPFADSVNIAEEATNKVKELLADNINRFSDLNADLKIRFEVIIEGDYMDIEDWRESRKFSCVIMSPQPTDAQN